MLESFGARLRQRREGQGIALVTIAEQTKIKLSLLEALERNDVSHWPSGIFRRAFIRAYAHAIGLNPDDVVREFLTIYPDPAESVGLDGVMTPDADAARTSGGPHTRLHYLFGSAIGSLSRLRRGASVEDPPAGSGTIRAQISSTQVLPAVAPQFTNPDLPAVTDCAGEPDLQPAAQPSADHAFESDAHTGELELTAAAHPPTEPDRNELTPDRNPLTTNEAAASAATNGAAQAGREVHAAADAPPNPGPADRIHEPAIEPAPAKAPAPFEPDVLSAAHLCTEFGRVRSLGELQPLLQEAAAVLDAIGLIVWIWDAVAQELTPELAHGYSDRVLAQLPAVRPDADNATAAAFRSARTCTISGSARESGALVVPLLTPAGCAGVLAMELQQGSEQTRSVRAIATIFAAQLAQLITSARPADVGPESGMMIPPGGELASPTFRANLSR
jgi:hypothetical protein